MDDYYAQRRGASVSGSFEPAAKRQQTDSGLSNYGYGGSQNAWQQQQYVAQNTAAPAQHSYAGGGWSAGVAPAAAAAPTQQYSWGQSGGAAPAAYGGSYAGGGASGYQAPASQYQAPQTYAASGYQAPQQQQQQQQYQSFPQPAFQQQQQQLPPQQQQQPPQQQFQGGGFQGAQGGFQGGYRPRPYFGGRGGFGGDRGGFRPRPVCFFLSKKKRKERKRKLLVGLFMFLSFFFFFSFLFFPPLSRRQVFWRRRRFSRGISRGISRRLWWPAGRVWWPATVAPALPAAGRGHGRLLPHEHVAESLAPSDRARGAPGAPSGRGCCQRASLVSHAFVPACLVDGDGDGEWRPWWREWPGSDMMMMMMGERKTLARMNGKFYEYVMKEKGLWLGRRRLPHYNYECCL
jgi:hypothetical protein